jgi:hypothetical protein
MSTRSRSPGGVRKAFRTSGKHHSSSPFVVDEERKRGKEKTLEAEGGNLFDGQGRWMKWPVHCGDVTG